MGAAPATEDPLLKTARKADGIPPPLVQVQPPRLGRALMGKARKTTTGQQAGKYTKP